MAMQPEEPAAQTGEPRWYKPLSDWRRIFAETPDYDCWPAPIRGWEVGALIECINALTEEKQEAEDSRDGFAADLDACEDKVKRLEAENVKLTKWANDANQVSLRYERQRDEERQKVNALTVENAGLRAALKDAVAHHKLTSGRCTWCGIVGFHQPGCTVAAWEQALNPKKEQGTDG